jgi:hypothetical protein
MSRTSADDVSIHAVEPASIGGDAAAAGTAAGSTCNNMTTSHRDRDRAFHSVNVTCRRDRSRDDGRNLRWSVREAPW